MMTPLDAATGLVLLEFKQAYGLGFVSPTGRIVTSFHVVVNETHITAHLHDGRAIPVHAVSGVDVKRDLVALDVGALDATPVKPAHDKLAEDGAPCFIFGMVANEGRARWVEARIAGVQVLGRGLSVYRVAGDIPADASGGPLVGADGTTLGVVMVAESDEGVVTFGVPWRYVAPLIQQNAGWSLKSLADKIRRPKREVPVHPLSLLEGSAVAGLEETTAALAGAIRRGAPAYNQGDVKKCFDVYAQTARHLIDSRADCPGVQAALKAGLHRAQSLGDVDHQAWAMRDTFDGLLSVIEKFLRHQGVAVSVRKGAKGTLLN